MRLAEYTDYTLRVLMYCAAHPGRLITISELAERHAVSKNHLMKVVNDLARQGMLETTCGRGGGLRLSMSPASIRVGDVVRHCETDFRLVECFDSSTNTCSLTPTCRLKGGAERRIAGLLQGAGCRDPGRYHRPRTAASVVKGNVIAARGARVLVLVLVLVQVQVQGCRWPLR